VDSPIDDRDSSIARLANGDLLVSYMSYDPARRPGTHQVFTVRSTDNGRTWSEPRRVPTPFTANEAVSEPVRELPDGRLLLPVYGSLADQPKPSYACGLVESADGGQTWRSLALIRSPRYELCEPSLVRFADGRLFMAIRPDMTWCESLDGGRTWTEPAPMPVSGDAPYLLLTSRNVLLCGFRHRPTRSTCVIASTDAGRTWAPMVTLDRVLGAYPSLVELPDGRVLVVYYTEGGGSDIRCVFLRAEAGAVRVLERAE
jgi:predicted neuraminidase